MPKRSGKNPKSQAKVKELVVVSLVEDMEQAKDYETLLKNNDIPTIIKEHHESSGGDISIAIMVPEDFLDEAHVVIEAQDAYDDFYDFSLEERDEDEFESDIFEDDF